MQGIHRSPVNSPHKGQWHGALIFSLICVGKPGFCFHYYCAVYDECKYSDTLWLADRVRLFVHYTISLSSLCKLIWGHWTYKIPVRYILYTSVWVRLSKHIAHFLSYPLYNIWGCVFSVYPFPLWWLREYTPWLIIIIKSEVWTIIHCLGLGHETMVCAVCLSIFFWVNNREANHLRRYRAHYDVSGMFVSEQRPKFGLHTLTGTILVPPLLKNPFVIEGCSVIETFFTFKSTSTSTTAEIW